MTGEPPIYGRVTRRYGAAPPPTYANDTGVPTGASTGAVDAAVADRPVTMPGADLAVADRASWGRRAAGFAIDAAPGILAVIALAMGYLLLLAAIAGDDASSATGRLPPHGRAAAIWLAVGGALLLVMLAWAIPNRWLAGGRTGRSLGRRVMGHRLLSEQTGEPIGAGNAFLRDLLHCIDLVSVVGFLWPLWDERRQTFADMIAQTVVVDDQCPTA
jgi:uncharacterized RDD family membrane protein YckC